MNKYILLAVLFIGIVGLSLGMFMAGYEYHQPREIIVDRWHEPNITSETIKEQLDSYIVEFNSLRNAEFLAWHSVEELEWWLLKNTISQRTYQKEYYDCDNFARDLTISAFGDNRMIGIYRDMIDNIPHLSNFAIINNEIYLVEAQTDKVTYSSKVDNARR